MTKYRNDERDRLLDEELAAEEAAYRKQFGPKTEEVTEVDPPAVTQDEEVWKKRHSDLRSYTQKQINDLNSKINELTKQLGEKEKSHAMPANREEVEQWVKDYPDLARVLGNLIDERAERQVSSVSDEVKTVKMELEAEREAIAYERAMAAIIKAHPDFLTLVNQDDFKEWVEEQPVKRGPRIGQALYDALYENKTDAEAAIQAINIFKADKSASKPSKAPREAALSVSRTSSASPSPTGGGKRVFTESEIDAMDRFTFDKYYEEIEDARREGRITYDQSGAAR